MLLTDSAYIGVDTTSGRKAFTYAAIDRGLNILAISDAELDEVVSFLIGLQSATVAINAPKHVNLGLVRKRLEKQSLTQHPLRGADIRVAEFDLHARGIPVGGTGSRITQCPAWVQLGFTLYDRLSKHGFKNYPGKDASHQLLETHPHACFCVLLGRSPLPKSTLEGRLQRELILFERGVRIKDPMEFFEEITRHKLLNGVLPMDLIHPPEQLDALAAALTAWTAGEQPNELSWVGDKREGLIALPGPSLKESY